jgi:hypothetical protein
VRTIIPNQSNPLKQEPDYSLQVLTSQNWTKCTRPPAWPRLPAPPVIKPSRPQLWLGLFMHNFVPCPQFICLLKPITYICTPKIAEDEWVLSLPRPMACPKPCNKSPFSAVTMPLYLGFMGRWPDLAYGISGVWAFGPKFWFQLEGRE